MRELIDCHVHTERCGHAVGSVDDYMRQAAHRGLWGVVFTEHLALPLDLDPDSKLSMRECDLEDYLVEVDFARERYPDIRVVAGLEADYLPERLAGTKRELTRARARSDGARMVLGSVHFIGDWAFDDPGHVDSWDAHDVDEAWEQYFALWCDAARCGLFDVMAHPDLVKKFGHRPHKDPAALYRQAAEAAADGGVLVEVSTAGLRRPVAEIYPGPSLLLAFCEAGVGATVGSDAHDPTEVGFKIEAAYDAMQLAGYTCALFPDGNGGWRPVQL